MVIVVNTLKRTWPDQLFALAVFTLCLGVYNATLTPSLSYKSPDGNELATVAYTLGLAHSTGYPLYTWLGKLFTCLPIGDVAHRVNLMSAGLGALGVAGLYGLLRLLTASRSPWRSRLACAFGALLFGFSRTFWSQTGIAEVYAPNLFMVVATLLCLLLWAQGRQAARSGVGWLWAGCLLYGLSLGTHLSNLGFAPALALFVLLVDRRILLRPKEWLPGALLFGLGVAQFLWLPYKAGSLNDPLMLRDAPTTLEGVYHYTLGAFPNFKFAFPLNAIPERIVLYLYLLRQNFGLAGIILGWVGMAALLWRRPKHFFLLIGIYLVNVWFFVQYRAFDIDVFFIPAHLVWAVCLGLAADSALQALLALRARWGRALATAGAVLLLALAVTGQVEANWEANDYSADTAINDFYTNVFDLLPQASVLLGQGGVFGFDAFYFRLVYNLRPDVWMPMLDNPRPNPRQWVGREVFSTEPAGSNRATPWSPPGDPALAEAWSVPLLLGQAGGETGLLSGERPLVLYHLTQAPPALVVDRATPQQRLDGRLGGAVLLGYDLDTGQAIPGGRLHLTLYWGLGNQGLGGRWIVTTLGETRLESHEPGWGNLARYTQEVRPLQGGVLVEDYWVVLPSTLEPGNYPLRVGLEEPVPAWAAAEPAAGPWLDLGTVTLGQKADH